MKFSMEKSVLVNALSTVSPATDKKEGILSNVLLEINEAGQAMFTSQDTEVCIQYREALSSLDFEVGSILLNPLSVEAIKKAPKGDLTLESSDEGKVINMKCGNYKTKFASIHPENYPPVVKESEMFTTFTITGEELKKINKVFYAAALENTRPILTGINFLLKESRLRIEALDGHKLGTTELTITNITKKEKPNFIVSAKKLQTANIDANAANVIVSVSKSYIYFITPQSVVAIKLLEGDYINVDQLLKQTTDNEKIIKIKRMKFLEALERTLIFKDGNTRLCVLNIGPDNKVRIKAEGKGVGKSEEIFEYCTVQGFDTEFRIAYNTIYLIDCIKNNFDSEDITIKFSSNTQPAIATNETTDIALVLPVRVPMD